MRCLLVSSNTINMLFILLCILIVFILLKCYKLLHLLTTNSNSDFSIYCDINRLIYSYFTNLLQFSLYLICRLLFVVSVG